MRYPIQLIPRGTIPTNTTIGVRLTPIGTEEVKVLPPAPCVTVCNGLSASGWMSADNVVEGVSGATDISLTGGPWTLQIFIDGTICAGSLLWAITSDTLVENVDYVSSISGTVVWLFGYRCDGYNGELLIQPTLDGTNFCEPLHLTFTTPLGNIWETDPPTYTEATVSIHTWDSTGPFAGADVDFIVTQESGSTITVLPYIVVNGANDFSLMFDATDSSELPATSIRIRHERFGNQYGDDTVLFYF